MPKYSSREDSLPFQLGEIMSTDRYPFANSLTKFLVTAPIRNADLAEKVADALNRGLESGQSIDELLMSASKLVDSRLRDALEQFTGATVGRGSAIEILDSCVKSGLIRNRDEPTYHYLFWYFGDRRNTSHHEFREYKADDLIAFIIQTQFALEQIEALRGRQRLVEAKFDVKQDPQKGLAKIGVSELWQASSLIQDVRVEAVIRRPDRLTETIPLMQSGSGWSGMYDFSYRPTGPYNFRIQGNSPSGPFVTSSGSLVYNSGRTCAKCKTPLEPFTAVCPRCSTNQSGAIFTASSY
jgi:hypothetical protein